MMALLPILIHTCSQTKLYVKLLTLQYCCLFSVSENRHLNTAVVVADSNLFSCFFNRSLK